MIRRLRGVRRLAGIAGAVLAAAPVATAGAAGYDGQTFHAAHDGTGAFQSYGAEPLPLWATHVDLFVDHARHPVVLKTGDDDYIPLVRGTTATELGAMIGLPFDVELGLALPFVQQDIVNPLGADGNGGIAASGMGDVRFIAKWVAFRSTNRLVPRLGFIGEVSAPTGDAESWMGAGVVRPAVSVAAQQNVGPVSLIANVGYRLFPGAEKVWGVEVGDELIYKLAATVNTGFQELEVLGEIAGIETVGGQSRPMEAGFGVRRPVWNGVSATAGLDRGIGDALGTPRWRYFAAVSYEFGGRKNLRAVTPAPEPLLAAPAPTPEPVPTPGERVALANPTPIPAATPAPTPVAPMARVTETAIEINQTIHFRKNSAVIEEGSFPILELVVEQLQKHPEIVKVSIEGHTDSTGNALFNLYLSKVRANSVRKFLVDKGIEARRLDTVGWGHERPISDNRTRDGRALNRRVEFRIEQRSSSP